MCLQYKSFENTVGKGEIARKEQFLLFPQCFQPVWRTLSHFHRIQNCCQQSLSTWKGLKFLVRERVNQYYQEYWPSWRSNQPPPILKSHLLLTEPHKLGIFFLSKTRLTTGWSLHQGFVRSRFVPRSQPFHLVKHRRAEV